jgi:undecaprenyl-diphosphatase
MMIQTIKFAEYEWFLWLNSFHTNIWDVVMFWVTYRFTWIPLYLYIIYFIFTELKTNTWRNLLFVIISVGLADRITSGFMKPYFQRFRPCHDPLIQNLVHVVGDCGGQYGFASSHAANCFALVSSMYILLNIYHSKRRILCLFLFFWAIFVSYSRIYVGVHFPTDLLVGGLVGAFIPLILFPLLNYINVKFYSTNS